MIEVGICDETSLASGDLRASFYGMNFWLRTSLCVVALAPVFSGCTMFEQARKDQARTDQTLNDVGRKVNQVDASVREMTQSRERMYARIDEVEQKAVASNRQRQQEISALKAEIRALRAEREAMRAQLVKELSSKMATAMQSYAAQAQASSARSQSGRLHRVESGQTLSEIARAYNVTVAAIMRENKMRSADVLKVGQELFIPE